MGQQQSFIRSYMLFGWHNWSYLDLHPQLCFHKAYLRFLIETAKYWGKKLHIITHTFINDGERRYFSITRSHFNRILTNYSPVRARYGCYLWFNTRLYILLPSTRCCMKYRVTLDCAKTVLDCIIWVAVLTCAPSCEVQRFGGHAALLAPEVINHLSTGDDNELIVVLYMSSFSCS